MNNFSKEESSPERKIKVEIQLNHIQMIIDNELEINQKNILNMSINQWEELYSKKVNTHFLLNKNLTHTHNIVKL